ncbi:glycosyltransferase [Gelidibacter japonicus]|uniref:glycosyltransferase n=1 Tax=Gelidibacter japonicus TaxID=1962232 RepID=UPI0020200A11|nr:glycosyltransferase [Gelidibacter japonicus]MCL8006656.1 glycosyltransferase [Gelidibacter japonicus]
MRLLINTATTFKGGGVQVAKSFIEECKLYSEHEFLVVLGLNIVPLINPNTFPSNFTFFKIPYRPATRVFSFKDPAEFLKKIEEEYNPDIVFTTSGPAYWKPKALHLMGFNLPHYIYGDSPYFQKISLLRRLKWKLKGSVIKHFVQKDANAYVVQTKDVMLRLKKWLKTDRSISTVSNTYGEQFNEVDKDSKKLLPEMEMNEFRFLILSAYYEHKNLEILNQIIPLIQNGRNTNIKFITTLPNVTFAKVFSDEAQKNILNVGPVKPDDCPQLYLETQAIFLPTLLECFSATYAEAMKMKSPIITTNLGFAKSICGNAALYYDPIDAQDAYNKIISLVEDPILYKGLLENAEHEILKFNSASERAAKYIDICTQMVKA